MSFILPLQKEFLLLLLCFFCSCVTWSGYQKADTLPKTKKEIGFALSLRYPSNKDFSIDPMLEAFYRVGLSGNLEAGSKLVFYDFIMPSDVGMYLKWRLTRQNSKFGLAICPCVTLSTYSLNYFAGGFYVNGIASFKLSRKSTCSFGPILGYQREFHSLPGIPIDFWDVPEFYPTAGYIFGGFVNIDFEIKRVRIIPEIVCLQWHFQSDRVELVGPITIIKPGIGIFW
jgi:hypothetical protein